MTKSVTPAELTRAGANSKPHLYKRKVQKMKDLPETWVLRRKQSEDLRRKKRETLFSTFQKHPMEYKDLDRVN